MVEVNSSTNVAPSVAYDFEHEAELAEIVRQHQGNHQALAIVGGGTKASLGTPTKGVRIGLGKYSGIEIYEPAALTLVAKAGTSISEIQKELDRENQHLAFEVPDFRKLLNSRGHTTLGGVAATGYSGSRAVQVGPIRDAMIGVRLCSGEGQLISSGGRVMKNVTGYDLVKPMAGAFGTLGILTQISLKLLPKPEMVATMICNNTDCHTAVAIMSKALSSPYEVSGAAHWGNSTYLRLEGFERSVAERFENLTRLMADLDLEGIEISRQSEPQDNVRIWEKITNVEPLADAPAGNTPGMNTRGQASDTDSDDSAIWRIVTQPSNAPGLNDHLEQSYPIKTLMDWGGGLVWMRVHGVDGDYGEHEIRHYLKQHYGHATLFRAPQKHAIKHRFPPLSHWENKISQGLRQQFDPGGKLNRGILD